MSRGTWPGDLQVEGNISAATFSIPANTMRNAGVAADADIAASKLQRGHVIPYAQESTLAAAVERKVLLRVRGSTATLVDFRVGSVTIATGTGSAVVTLLKNGVAVLTVSVTLDSANTPYVPEAAAGFSSTSLVAGDVLELSVISSAVGTGTKPVGLFCELVVDGVYA